MSCLQPWTEDIFTLRANPGCQHDWSRNQLKDILLGGSLTVSPQEINWGRTDSTFWLWAFTFCCLQALMLIFPPCPTSDPAFSASIKHGQKSSDPLTAFWLMCQTGTSKTSSQVDWVLLDSLPWTQSNKSPSQYAFLLSTPFLGNTLTNAFLSAPSYIAGLGITSFHLVQNLHIALSGFRN